MDTPENGGREVSAMQSKKRTEVWDVAYLLLLSLTLLAALVVTGMSLTHGENTVLILSDGKSYYVWARSLLLDGDVDFQNDYHLIYPPDPLPRESAKVTPTGRVVNKFPVGMAILETPGLLLGHVAARYLVHSPTDGLSTPYQVAVVWSLIAFYVASFALLYRAMLDLGVSRMWALGFCLTSLVGTNLVHYIAKEPSMAHASGMALLNVLVFLAVRWSAGHRRVSPAAGALFGALVGLLFLVRNTNLLLIPVLGAIVFTKRRIAMVESLPVLAGAVVVAALQPISLWFLWGRLRFSTYVDEAFTSGIPGILNALGSPRHGLFVYHPWYAVLLLLAIYAAIRVPRLRSICLAAMTSFLLMALANGTWWCWWFGYSFGNRAFIESLCPLTVAAALSISQLSPGRRASAVLVAGMAAIVVTNLYLWVGYLLQAYPFDGSHSIAQAYLWPFYHSLSSLLNQLSP